MTQYRFRQNISCGRPNFFFFSTECRGSRQEMQKRQVGSRRDDRENCVRPFKADFSYRHLLKHAGGGGSFLMENLDTIKHFQPSMMSFLSRVVPAKTRDLLKKIRGAVYET